MASVVFAPLMVQGILAGLLLCRISLDVWRYFSFKSYSLVNDKAQAKTWENILQEFTDQKSQNTAFYGISRNNVKNEIESIMKAGIINQTDNNLCGPIAFLNFLIIHHPTLFVKTLCEYAENGGTYAPFYLQSSFWDRYAYFLPIGLINKLFTNHYTSFGQAFAAAFKNTHNLLGYSNSCLFEVFKGSTEPKKIVEWLTQAGFECSSNVTVKNYSNNKEIPWLNRFILGGLYENDVRKNSGAMKNEHDNVCHIHLAQSFGGTPLHFLFNVAAGHWTFTDDQKCNNNCIQIQLRKPEKI